jgi:hypothetical protein
MRASLKRYEQNLHVLSVINYSTFSPGTGQVNEPNNIPLAKLMIVSVMAVLVHCSGTSECGNVWSSLKPAQQLVLVCPLAIVLSVISNFVLYI